MWDPAAMISACFAYSSRRWEVARRELALAGGVAAALPRKYRECVQPRNVGPFPYAKGLLLGYSASAARLLVSLFDCCGDEGYALTARRTTAFAHPYLDRLLAPSSRQHPSKSVMVEDVYYMHLLFKALGRNGSLTLLHFRTSEFVVERGARALTLPLTLTLPATLALTPTLALTLTLTLTRALTLALTRCARTHPRRHLPQAQATRPLRVDPRAAQPAPTQGGRGRAAERKAAVRADAASLPA